MAAGERITADVAIVGFGPTGATLANLLCAAGVSVVVIEREAAMYHLPRAVHFDGETMRVFQTCGIADDLAARVHINPGMRFVSPAGDLLLDWPRPADPGPQGWHASYRLHQPDLEELLRARLALRPGATILSRTEVTGIAETDHGVVLTGRGRDGAADVEVHALYAVGCDGARSFMRRDIGAETEDLGFQERWLVVDLILTRPRPDLGDHSIQFCDPARPMTYCRSPGDRRRWEITVHDDEPDDAVLSPARIWAFLEPWIDPSDARLERAAVYTFRSSLARRWRRGRRLIAGDAAHLTPPFMGQGMCTGIRDAANLAWKLALCCQGKVSDDLLDTYQAERAPHARAFIETAMRLGGLINSLDAASALTLASDTKGGAARLKTIAPNLGDPGPCGLWPGQGPHARTLAPQPRLEDGRLLDDAVGYAPVVIARRDWIRAHPPDDARIAVLSDAHPELSAKLAGLHTGAVLVRPDRYIAATADTLAGFHDLMASPLLRLGGPLSAAARAPSG